MSSSTDQIIRIGARDSALSRAQVTEVLLELKRFSPQVEFDPLWTDTVGDRDLTTSLRFLDKTDFFTRDLDLLQLSGACRITIHSAKDLPDPLPQGLTLVALTKGVDSSDALVFRGEETLEGLPFGAKVGTSSLRREASIRSLRLDLNCVDIRGSVVSRLDQLDKALFDAVVIAEAALIRLGLTHRSRLTLPGATAPLQGQLAILAREEDEQMHLLFAPLDSR